MISKSIQMQKLSHITALRGVAILSVLIFHAFPSALPGGYLGVDIFFVISGFLITSILLRDMENKSFSFAVFYKKRILRLMPAFFALLLLALIVIALFYLPNDIRGASNSARSAIFFNSNMFFAKHLGGYFGSFSEIKPFIHFWSLSIEWQFYLAFPLAFFIIFKLFKKANLLAFWIIFIAIFASTFIHFNVEDSYYLAHFRALEIMCGVFLALFLQNTSLKSNNKFSSIFLIALILCLFIFLKSLFIPPPPPLLR